MVEKFMIEKPGVEKSGIENSEVEKSGVGKFFFDFGFKSSWFKSLGLKNSWLKSLGLKLGVEKSGVEISFNQINHQTSKQRIHGNNVTKIGRIFITKML